MNWKHILIAAVLFSLTGTLHSQQMPLTAEEILKEAYEAASKENKKVFIIFHASWCGWCRKMDASMNDESCKKFFDGNFVVRHLVVQESKNKKHLENPGAEEFNNKYGGKDEGLPYWLIFDKNGNLLADSKIRPEGVGLDSPGDNSGCPATVQEVEFFISVLKKTTGISAEQEVTITKRFRQNEQ